MSLRSIGTEVLFRNDPYIYEVVEHVNVAELHLDRRQRVLPPMYERIEAIGKLQNSEKHYFDGRVEHLEDWQI